MSLFGFRKRGEAVRSAVSDRYRFRPMLEGMDDRFVPNATPLAASVASDEVSSQSASAQQAMGFITIDFTSMTVNGQIADADEITVVIETADDSYPISVSITSGMSPAGIAAAVATAVEQAGFTDVTVNGNVVTVQGPAPNGEAITGGTVHHSNSLNGSPAIATAA